MSSESSDAAFNFEYGNPAEGGSSTANPGGNTSESGFLPSGQTKRVFSMAKRAYGWYTENGSSFVNKAVQTGNIKHDVPEAEKIQERFGVSRHTSHFARAGLQVAQVETLPEDGSVGSDVIEGIKAMVNGHE
jgi:hypothetical protein